MESQRVNTLRSNILTDSQVGKQQDQINIVCQARMRPRWDIRSSAVANDHELFVPAVLAIEDASNTGIVGDSQPYY